VYSITIELTYSVDTIHHNQINSEYNIPYTQYIITKLTLHTIYELTSNTLHYLLYPKVTENVYIVRCTLWLITA
jgi:hypothetical protein